MDITETEDQFEAAQIVSLIAPFTIAIVGILIFTIAIFTLTAAVRSSRRSVVTNSVTRIEESILEMIELDLEIFPLE